MADPDGPIWLAYVYVGLFVLGFILLALGVV